MNEREYRWEFDPTKFDSGRVSEDADTEFFFSPYDVPDSLIVRQYPASNVLVIEFKHIDDDEKRRCLALDNGLRLWLGKSSGRILAIQVEADKLDSPELKKAIEDLPEAIEKPGSLSWKKRPLRVDNFESTRRIMSEYLSDHSPLASPM